jgi:hypothetical protein
MRIEALIDLPISLAIDTNLSAGVERLQNCDERITTGYEIYGRGAMLTHEIEDKTAIRAMFSHLVDVLGRRDHLRSNCMIVADGQLTIHEAQVVRRDTERYSELLCGFDGVALFRGQLNEIEQWPCASNDVL